MGCTSMQRFLRIKTMANTIFKLAGQSIAPGSKQTLLYPAPNINTQVKIEIPVHIFHGDKDDLVPIANADYTKRMLVNSKNVITTIFPGGNHFMVWNKYDEIKKQLLQLENY